MTQYIWFKVAHIRFNVFRAGNLLFTMAMVSAGMYLAGRFDELGIGDLILPLVFGFIGSGFMFIPFPRISEKTCTHLHLSSGTSDLKTIALGAAMLLLWVFFFGSNERSASGLFLHIAVFATGFLLLQKWVFARAIYALLGDEFEPKCKICDPLKYAGETDEDDDDEDD